MARLYEVGPLSQNLLGRQIAVDAATIKGVVDRLSARDLVSMAADPSDGRLRLIALTREGRRTAKRCIAAAVDISAATLQPLATEEHPTILRLLGRLADGDSDGDVGNGDVGDEVSAP